MPTAAPQNVAIQSSTATQLDVTWDPPPVEAQNGDIQGYKVQHFSVIQQFKVYNIKQWFFEPGTSLDPKLLLYPVETL